MNSTEHLLAILAEESAEIAQRATKALRFGLEEVQPGHVLNNRDRILKELHDLWAVVEMLDLCVVSRDAIERKKAKVEYFLKYSQECGTLTP